MPQNSRDRSSSPARFDRGLGLTLGAGLALLLVLGLVFSAAYGSQRITRSATSLHAADETLRAATVVRAQLAIASYTLAVDTQFGTHSGPARDLAVAETGHSLADIEAGHSDLIEGGLDGESLSSAIEQYVAVGISLLASVEANRSDDQLSTELESSFGTLTDELVAVRNELAATVAESDRMLGYIGTAGRFLVAFFVPAAIILLYRELVRRQQRQAELERRLAAERDLAASRDEFIANASHELRTPLTGILGMALLLEEEPALQDSEMANELLSMVISEAGDLSRMVDDLLTTARLDSGALHFAFQDVDVVEETADTVEALTRSGIAISIDTEPGLVRADRLRLRQVIRNLLSNASKYGGPNIRVEGTVEGATYVWSVVDDGPGVAEVVLSRLFQPFVHRGKDVAVTDSVGLGLSIVHALVHGMGGGVAHERIDGETHFIVRLPLVGEKLAGQGRLELPQLETLAALEGAP